MCGIAGILNFNDRSPKRDTLIKMCDRISHRGPDGHGYYCPEQSPIALGHRRLSIIDLSEKAAQPMHSSCGGYHITFNGEIYNYKELKELLPEELILQSDSDTEILLELYVSRGASMLSHLDGMFAFAIWDEKDKVLFCARDRFGEKPFFYSIFNGAFTFASEIKALRAAGVIGGIATNRASDYLTYGIQEDYRDPVGTSFEECFQLQAGHSMVVGLKGPSPQKKYWSLERKLDETISFEEASHEFNRLFFQSIERRLRSDVPVGSSLSGGLDSSSILAMLKQTGLEMSSYKSFSARFEGFQLDEGKYIDIMNADCGVKGHAIYLQANDFQETLDHILYHQDEPIGSSSIIAQYMVMKAAKDAGVKVLLDGQGADEFLAGYPLYMNTFSHELATERSSEARKEEEGLLKMHGISTSSAFSKERLRRRFPRVFSRTASLRNSLRSVKDPHFRGLHPDLIHWTKNSENPLKTFSTVHDHLQFSLQQRGLNELLRYADRNSMAHSVEVRLPFLSHELVAFVLNLPTSYLIKDGWSKYLLRKTMEDRLPEEICWRKDKVGYTTPEDKWLRSAYFEDRKQSAVDFLKKEKIIVSENADLAWRYISLAASMQGG